MIKMERHVEWNNCLLLEYKFSGNVGVDMFKRTKEKEKEKHERNFFFKEKPSVGKLFFFFLIYLKFRSF